MKSKILTSSTTTNADIINQDNLGRGIVRTAQGKGILNTTKKEEEKKLMLKKKP